MARTITSANSQIILTVPGIFDNPVQLQGFAADNIFEIDNVSPVETVMGVDGNFSLGWVPVPTPMNISIMPDSLSSDFFETWGSQQDATREAFPAMGSVLLPATGRKYTMLRGALTGFVKLPSAARTLQARRFTITWGSVTPANS